MSLIIASNKQDEYSSKDLQDPSIKVNYGTDIQNPSSFQNYLTNPLRIPPHSEVALQSIFFNRRRKIVVRNGMIFYWYNGLALDWNKENDDDPLELQCSLNAPKPVFLKPGSYGISEFRWEMKRALKATITHPTWWNNTDVEIEWNSDDGNLVGLNYVFQGNTKASSTKEGKTLTNWRGWDINTSKAGGDDDWEVNVDGDDIKVKRNLATDAGDSRNCSIINTDCPMELVNGAVYCDLFKTFDPTGDSVCGFWFSRPKNYTADMPYFRDTPQGATAPQYDRTCYGDYRIDWKRLSPEDDSEALVLSQASWSNLAEDFDNGTRMKEIKYWTTGLSKPGTDNPVDAQIKKANIGTLVDGSGSGYTGDFKIKFVGSGMTLWMSYWTDSGFGGSYAWKMICDTTDDTDTDNREKPEITWTPINQNKEALYLGWSAANKDHESKFYGVILNTDVVGTGAKGDDAYLYGDEDTCGTSWWAQTQNLAGGGTSAMMNETAVEIEKRINQRMMTDAQKEGEDGADWEWEDLDASDEVPAKTKALVFQSGSRKRPFEKGIYWTHGIANCDIGFAGYDQIASNYTGTSKEDFGTTYKLDGTTKVIDPCANWEVAGSGVPISATPPVFVRCPSLTMESYNFCKSIPSQIIAMVPATTGSGVIEGGDDPDEVAVFHQPSEKTYIKLRNTDWINLNNLQIDIVDKNENIVDSLSGTTTLVLHIKHQDERAGI